jgi:capsid protein
MIKLIRAPLASASSPIAENSFGDRDQEIQRAGQREAAEQDARVGPGRLGGLLGDVDRVLEADQGVERERRPGEDRSEHALSGLELECAAHLTLTLGERARARLR